MTRRPAVCLIVGLTLMTLALAWFTPFGAFPDELDHYERALSIGNGELAGVRDPEPPIVVRHKTCCVPGNRSARSWVRQGVRFVRINPAQRPEQMRCASVVTSPRLSCGARPDPGRQANAMGTIEPLAYAPGGLVANMFSSPEAAHRVTRLVPALLSLLLVAMAVFALWRRFRSPATFAAIVACMSVGTLSVIASGSPNAFEVAGALAVLAGGLALTDDSDIARADWWCLGPGGLALATSRSLGPIWVVALLAVAVVAGSWRRTVEKLRCHRWAAFTVIAVIAFGALTTAAWEAAVQPHVAFDLRFFIDQLGPSVGDARFAGRQFFSSVGSLPPAPFAWLWAGLILTIVVVGLALGDGRSRRAVALAGALTVGAFVMISAAVLRQNGFGIQARHVLPVLVAFVVIGGVSWRRTVPPLVVTTAVALGAAGLLVVGWAYLRASYVTTPTGLSAVAPSLRDALHSLRSIPSLIFVTGAVLAASAVPLSAREAGARSLRAAPRDA